MILNAKSNQFILNLPKGFLYEEVSKKFEFYLKRYPGPFDSIESYLNHTIQSVAFPSVAAEDTEQFLNGRPQYWRDALDLERIISKEFTVNFKTADGYLNYWIMFEQMRYFLQEGNTNDYFPDFNLRFLDRDGYQMLNIIFNQPIMKSIDSIEMSYAQSGLDFRTFGVTFKYNQFEIKVELD